MRIILAAIYPYAFLLLYLIIPFDNYIRALPNILMAILLIAFPFIVKREDFKKLKNGAIFLFALLFIYLVLNTFFVERWAEDGKVLMKVLLALGLAVLYIPVADFNKINRAIIFSSLAAILFSVYHFVLITDATGNFSLGDSPQVVEALLIDRLYLGLLAILSIMVSANSINIKYAPENNYHLANILVNVVFIFLIESKIALAILLILFILKVLYKLKYKARMWAVGGILAILIFGFFIVKPFQTLRNMDTSFTNNSTGIFHDSKNLELRFIVWGCVNKVIVGEDFTWSGFGFNGSKDKLVTCYGNSIKNPAKRDMFLTERYNSHNQLADFYLSAGFIALILFLLFIIFCFFSVSKNYFPTAMLVILVLYCLVENLFQRQIGAYYVGFILIMLSAYKHPPQNSDLKHV